MKTKNSITIYILIVIGIMVLLNIIASRFFFRLDFTADKQYTLSQATKNILKELDDPITVTAYFSEDLPPAIATTRQDFKDMLTEFASRAKGNIVYEFINPNKDEKTEQEAMQEGISPVMINVREKDQSVQKKAYLGAVIHFGEKKEVIPFMQPGSALEYALASGIKKLTVTDKPVIGFIQGQGEPSISSFSQAMSSLRVLYDIESVNLTDSTDLLKYKTLALVNPSDSLSDSQLSMLDDYLSYGGSMYVAINRVDGDLSQALGSEVSTGVESWLANKGLTIEKSFVLDANCSRVSVRQQQGMFTFTSQVTFPYLPVISTFEEHPITEGLESLVLQFASPIRYSGDTTNTFTPILLTSNKSATEQPPLYFNIQRKWQNSDFPMSSLTVGGILEGSITGGENARIVLISDGDFAINGEGQAAHQLQPDNVNLMVNSIDWLSDDTGLISLRTKGVTSRPIEQVEDSTKTLLKYLNFLLPIILIVIYGVAKMQRNKMIRFKRMNENYF